MQLLIVHRDPEMGEALVQMVKSYTRHHCQLVDSDKAAIDWAGRHQHCDLLLVQLEAEGVDGLVLGSSLSEIFPALQVLFFPNYTTTGRRLEVAHTKVFPEPVEGDNLLSAIERAGNAPPNSPDLFQVADILQMCCLSHRDCALQLVKESKSGLIFLRNGRIVHAETTTERGRDALVEIVNWKLVEFAYEGSVRPPVETVDVDWPEILMDPLGAGKKEDPLESHPRLA